jgi:arylsulfatase A-like enzyme
MPDKPNILVIWGDDIGWWNVSAYNHGTMRYRTPNIDRIGGAENSLERANADGWTVVSIKDDWATVFAG